MATTTYAEKVPGPRTGDLQQKFQSERLVIPGSFGVDITGATLSADYQAKVWTGMTIDRSGNYNFNDATFQGSFPKATMAGGDVPTITDASTGAIELIIPADMYDGPLNPNPRGGCVVVEVGLTITYSDGSIETYRIDYLITDEAGNDNANPTGHTGYVAYA